MKNLLIVSLVLLVFSSVAQAFVASPLQVGVRRTATNLSVFDGKSTDFKLPNISEFYVEWRPVQYLGVEVSWQESLASIRTENYDLNFVTSPTITLKVYPLDLGPVDFFIGFGAEYIEASGEYRTDRTACIFYPTSRCNNVPAEHIQTKNSVNGENMSFVVQAGIGFPITNRLSIGIGVKCIQGFSMDLNEGKIRVGDGPWTDYPCNNGRISVIRLFQSNIGFNYSF
jgi:hypothetical protein